MLPSLDQGSDLSTILNFILYIIVLAVTGLGGSAIGYNKARQKFKNKKEKRLFDNIQRPVALVPSSEDSLQFEERLLKSIDFFSVDLLPTDPRSVDELTNKYRLAIIRYENTDTFWQIFSKIKDLRVPVIVYSEPAEIQIPELKKIQEYSRYALCNTPVRLASDVYAIMSVYPEDRVNE